MVVAAVVVVISVVITVVAGGCVVAAVVCLVVAVVIMLPLSLSQPVTSSNVNKIESNNTVSFFIRILLLILCIIDLLFGLCPA